MSFNPVNRRDMINATRAALARLRLANRTPPSPVSLEDEEEVITDEKEVNSQPSTPPGQIMPENPLILPSNPRQVAVQQRLIRGNNSARRVLHFRPETPGINGERNSTHRAILRALNRYLPTPRKGKLNFSDF